MNISNGISRRDAIKTSMLAAALPGLRLSSVFTPQATDSWRGLKIGVASYTLRKFPLDAAIKMIQRVGLHYVSIKDAHLSLKSTADERKAVAQKFKDAGITPMSCGNISMKDAAEARQALEYARDAGIPTIVCAPVRELIPELDKLVKEFNIRLAIHNHGPEDKNFPSPYDVLKAVEKQDERIGLCIDVGHTWRAKVDPAEAIVKCKARLYDVHLKDILRSDRNQAAEGGRGILDLKGILKALLEVKFQGLAGFEYEKDDNDPLPGLSESVGYVRGLLAGM